MYAELKCRSNFSFLRGASDAREHVERAVELRLAGIAMTDLNGVYGLPRAWEVARLAPELNLIAGAELRLRDHPHLTLLCRDRAAYGLLCRMITALHAGKPKGEGSLSWSEWTTLLDQYPEKAQGLIVLPETETHRSAPPLRWEELRDRFSDRLFRPLCLYEDGRDQERIDRALAEAKRFGLRLLAHNDVHYHRPERRRVQDTLACIRESVPIQKAGFKLFGNAERHLKSPIQMRALFRDYPDAIRATLDVSESCKFKLTELRYFYPRELTPEGHTPQSYLEKLVQEGADRIYQGAVSREVTDQIQHELKLIQKLDYSSYFLTLADIVHYARSIGIICQGRGSAANSIICYCLGITAIDPVRMGLLFERFISEERGEPPDIDVDFEHERREEVIQYVYARYGRDHAGMVSAIRTYREDSAFLEVSKAFGVPIGTISADQLREKFDTLASPEQVAQLPEIESIAEEIGGFPRHLSIHSGGFTLSADPIIETVPIEPARMPGRTIIQWDKHDLDTVGLLKVDLLSLGFLTALHKICDLLKMDWRDIPPEDPETYAMIQRADTDGTFQIESRAQKSMLPRTRPANFYDLVVQVAIVRPGPNVGEMIHPYIQRRLAARQGRPHVLPDADTEKVLGRTYGVPIFQEQIMKLAIVKAGFSPGEADQLRRAIAAWRSADRVGTVSARLYEGLLKNGVSKAFADELLGYVKGYAHYGFPESHAASFALITYKSAYLKCHYPTEFLCGILNAQPFGFYSIDTLIANARRNGVRVLPIDPNSSDWDARLEGPGVVRMGFRNVRAIKKGDVVSEEAWSEELRQAFTCLSQERTQARFVSLFDFVKRTRFSTEVLGALAMANAFESFGEDERHAYWKALEYRGLISANNEQKQSPIFIEDTRESPGPLFAPLTEIEAVEADYHALGYSLRGDFVEILRRENPWLPKLNAASARKLKNRDRLQYFGRTTVMQRPPTAKGVCFVTLEDESGQLDVVLKREVYERYRLILKKSRFIVLEGQIQHRDGSIAVLVDQVSLPKLSRPSSASDQRISVGAPPRSNA